MTIIGASNEIRREGRLEWIDIAKCIGIILVLIAHAITRYTYLWNFINQFHLPLFYMLSGITYKHENTLYGYVRKKVINLWLPYIICCLLAILLDTVCGSLMPWWERTSVQPVDIIKYIFMIGTGPLLGAMWFMGVLFYALILTRIVQVVIRRVKKKTLAWSIDLGIAVLMLIIGLYTCFPYRISNILVAYFYVYCGRKVFNFARLEHRTTYSLVILGCLSLLILGVVSFFSIVSVSMNTYTNRGLFLLSSIAGCCLVITLSLAVERKLNIQILRDMLFYIGQHSYDIAAFQFWGFKLIILCQMLVYSLDKTSINAFPIIYDLTTWYWTVAYVFAGIAISIIIFTPVNIIRNRVKLLCK